MKSHVTGLLLVDALDDIDLTTVRPVRADHPECRPGTAYAARHVVDIDDEEPELIGAVAGQANARTPISCHPAAIHHHHCVLGCVLDQPVPRSLVRLILDKAMSRVGRVPKSELIEEVAVRKVIFR